MTSTLISVLISLAASGPPAKPLATAKYRLGAGDLWFSGATLVAQSSVGDGEQTWRLPDLKERHFRPQVAGKAVLGVVADCVEVDGVSFVPVDKGVLLTRGALRAFRRGGSMPAVSPDGKRLAFVADDRVRLWRVHDAFKAWPAPSQRLEARCRRVPRTGIGPRPFEPEPRTGNAPTAAKEQMATPPVRKIVGQVKLLGKPNTVLKRRIRAFKACYERVLKERPQVAGTLTLSFVVGDAGRVTQVRVTENKTGDDDLGQCVRKKIAAFRFAPGLGELTAKMAFLL